MGIKTVRRLAADIMGVGENKVWISPDRMSDASSALTRDDVKALILQGVIRAEPLRGVSRYRGRMNDALKRKGRGGPGSRKGSIGARRDSKKRWTAHTRAQRDYLRKVKTVLKESSYRRLYLKIKGGEFKSRAQLAHYIKDNNLIK